MPPKRNSLGMFSKKETVSATGISKYWTNTALFIFVVLIIISPWIYMLIKKNVLSGVSDTLKEFYESNFSCVCPNNNTANGNEKLKGSL